MNEPENIDVIARDLLLRDEVLPSDAVWAGIAKALPKRKKKVFAYFPLKVGIIGVLVILLAVSAWWFQQESTDVVRGASKTAKIENASRIENNKKDVAEANAGEEQQVDKEQLEGQNITSRANEKSTSEDELSTESEKKETFVQKEWNTAAANGHERASSNLEVNPYSGQKSNSNPNAIDGGFGAAYYQKAGDSAQLFDEKFEEQLEYNDLIKLEALSADLPINRELPALQPSDSGQDYWPIPQAGWYVGAFASLRSTALSISRASEGTSSLVDSLLKVENLATNAGFGLSFGYNLSSKWRISSGIAYAKWCRRTSQDLNFSLPENFAGVTAGIESIVPIDAEILSATGNYIVNVDASSAELINSEQAVFDLLSYSAAGTLEECYELLEIPILLEYHWKTNRFSLLPGAGFAYEGVLSRQTILENPISLGGEILLSDEGSNANHFISFIAALHLEYQLTRSFSARAGLSYQQWLSPFYENRQIKTYPRLVSVDAGIIYTFQR